MYGWTLQRKSCTNSSGVGCLKPTAAHPAGFIPVKMWRTTPSLPAASRPCRTTSREMLSFGIHQILQLLHFLDVLLNLRQSFLVFTVIARVEMLEPNLGPWHHNEFFHVIRHD